MDENEEEWYFYDEAKKLSCLIKEYVDCPVNELLKHEFNDRFKLTRVRRISAYWRRREITGTKPREYSILLHSTT